MRFASEENEEMDAGSWVITIMLWYLLLQSFLEYTINLD